MTTIKNKNDMLEITTNIYQARSGALIILFGNKSMTLPDDIADIFLYDIKDFDLEKYNEFYRGGIK